MTTPGYAEREHRNRPRVSSRNDPAELEAERIAEAIASPAVSNLPICSACASGGGACAACVAEDMHLRRNGFESSRLAVPLKQTTISYPMAKERQRYQSEKSAMPFSRVGFSPPQAENPFQRNLILHQPKNFCEEEEKMGALAILQPSELDGADRGIGFAPSHVRHSPLPSSLERGRVGLNPHLARAINNTHGEPLPAKTQAFFESRLGVGFNDVRIHPNIEPARRIRAKAFTVGRDVYFDTDRYEPNTTSGMRLLAHELTHVTQQRRLGSGNVIQFQDYDDFSDGVSYDQYGEPQSSGEENWETESRDINEEKQIADEAVYSSARGSRSIISYSVGDPLRGAVNLPVDVRVVQIMLAKHMRLLDLPSPIPTGLIDGATIQAIREYQRLVMGFKAPDGRVDPNGRTIDALQSDPLSVQPENLSDLIIAESIREAFEGDFARTEELVRGLTDNDLRQGIADIYHQVSGSLSSPEYSEMLIILEILETEESYRDALKTATSLLTQARFGRSIRQSAFQREYWEVTPDSANEYGPMLVLRSGILPSTAIDSMFMNLSEWSVDCAEFGQVAQLYALWKSMGDERFNREAKKRMKFRIWIHQSTLVDTILLYHREYPGNFMQACHPSEQGTFYLGGVYFECDLSNASIEDLLDRTPYGSRVMWTNLEKTEGDRDRNQNTVKKGKNVYATKSSAANSRKMIEEQMACSVLPRKDECLDEHRLSSIIKESIFVSEIEFYKPYLAAW